MQTGMHVQSIHSLFIRYVTTDRIKLISFVFHYDSIHRILFVTFSWTELTPNKSAREWKWDTGGCK